MPAPHQVAQNVFENTFLRKVTSNRSLVYHAAVTLSSTLLGFAFGTALGILIAVGIVHIAALDRSLMPWIIASQTIPILAVAPMIVVVLAAVNVKSLARRRFVTEKEQTPPPGHRKRRCCYNVTTARYGLSPLYPLQFQVGQAGTAKAFSDRMGWWCTARADTGNPSAASFLVSPGLL